MRNSTDAMKDSRVTDILNLVRKLNAIPLVSVLLDLSLDVQCILHKFTVSASNILTWCNYEAYY